MPWNWHDRYPLMPSRGRRWGLTACGSQFNHLFITNIALRGPLNLSLNLAYASSIGAEHGHVTVEMMLMMSRADLIYIVVPYFSGYHACSQRTANKVIVP